MRHIIKAKAQQVPAYRNKLRNAEEIIVEALPGDNYWSCGVPKDQVEWVDEKDWPGQNIMGKLHMELRTELQEH